MSDFLDPEQREKKKRGGIALVLFFAGKKLWTLAVGGAVVGATAVALAPPGSLRRLLPGSRSANPFGQGSSAAAGPAMPARRAVSGPNVVQGVDAAGEQGPENVTGTLPQPGSIVGIVSGKDARRLTNAVRVDQAPAKGQISSDAPGGTGLPSEPVAGGALAGKAGAKSSETYDNTILGMDATPGAKGASQSKTFMAHGEVSRGVLRAFLANNAKLKVEQGDNLTTDKGGDSPTYQLAEAKVSSNYFQKSATNEGKSMVGVVYDGHKVDKNVITTPSDPPPVKGDEKPDVGCKGAVEDGSDSDSMAARAKCMEWLPRTQQCDSAKVSAQVQLAMNMRKLEEVSALLDQECDPVVSALCPVDCVPCQKNSAFRTNLCNIAISPQIAVANQDCNKQGGIPAECQKFLACSADSGGTAVIKNQPAQCSFNQHCTPKHQATDPICFGRTQGGGPANLIQNVINDPVPATSGSNTPVAPPQNPSGGQ